MNAQGVYWNKYGILVGVVVLARHFTFEKHMELKHFNLWKCHLRHEIGVLSRTKCLIQMLHELFQNFACEILIHERYISHMKLKIQV